MYSSRGYANAWVSPFGTAVVKGPLRLVPHFRGLARPSSPADAKASPACIPSLKSCFPAIQLDLLLHEQLESTIDSWCFKSLCACCFFVCCRQSFQSASCRSDTLFPCAGALSSGAKETRTPNIQLAKLALYQLSYNPERYGPEWT